MRHFSRDAELRIRTITGYNTMANEKKLYKASVLYSFIAVLSKYVFYLLHIRSVSVPLTFGSFGIRSKNVRHLFRVRCKCSIIFEFVPYQLGLRSLIVGFVSYLFHVRSMFV